MAIHEKLTVSELLAIKKLPRSMAKGAIKDKGLSESEQLQILDMALPDPDPKSSAAYTPSDSSLWMAAAHLLGASFAEIAADFKVARQSAMARVERVLPVTHRKHQRLALELPLETYSEYKIAFFENVDMLRTKEPLEIARWLHSHVDLDTEGAA